MLIGITTWLYKTLDIPDGFFLAVGVNIMLQPDLGSGVSRLQIYSLGTVAGSVVGATIGVSLDGVPIAIAVITAATFFLLTSYIVVTYWAFAVGISVAIVAVLGLIVPGDWDIGMWRIANTLLAAVFVAIGMLVLLPSKGRKIVPQEFARSLEHTASFLQATARGEEQDELDRRRELLSVEDNTLALRMERYAKEPTWKPAIRHTHQRMLLAIRRIQCSVANLALYSSSPGPFDAVETELAERVAEQLRLAAEAYGRGAMPSSVRPIIGPGAKTRWERPDLQVALLEIGVAAQSILGYVDKAGLPVSDGDRGQR